MLVREAIEDVALGRDEDPEVGARALLPPEVQQEGLAAFKRIGEEVSEVIERRPESLVVVRFSANRVQGNFLQVGACQQPDCAG